MLGSLNTLVSVSIAITVLAIISPVAFGQNDSTVDLEKIEALFDEEKYEEVLSYVDEILKKNPKDEDALHFKTAALWELDRYEEAHDFADKTLEINPENEEVLYIKAKALSKEENYNEALDYLDKVLEINPLNDKAWSYKGRVFDKQEMYEEAISYYEKSLEINPNNHVTFNRMGNTLTDLGNIDEAMIFYDKALKIKPDYLSALYNKGNAFFDLERYEEAIEYYDKALEIDPKDEDAFYNRGLALKNLGRYELGSTIFPNEIKKGIIYETFGPIISGNPLVCIVEFEDESSPTGYIDRALKETGYAISEWEAQLKRTERYLEDQHIWEIDYTIVSLDESSNYDYSKCDVTIRFSDMPEDPDLQTFAIGIAEPNEFDKANIDIYYTQIGQCKVERERVGDVIYHYYAPCYLDREIPTDQIATTVRHEFGHALGLGHYYSDNQQTNVNWSTSQSSLPSIMVRFAVENESYEQIRTVDIEMIQSLYGEKGFLANLKAPLVETPFSDVSQDEIPDWIRNNAKWWSEGAIGDSDFTNGIQFMIKENIISIPDLPEQATETAEGVPDWVRNNAGWWADGLISDDDFISGIKYLVEQGIIRV